MFLYLIKHRILIRMRFIDIKSLHVMYYLPFERLMGLWIINEFLNKNSIYIKFSNRVEKHFMNYKYIHIYIYIYIYMYILLFFKNFYSLLYLLLVKCTIAPVMLNILSWLSKVIHSFVLFTFVKLSWHLFKMHIIS